MAHLCNKRTLNHAYRLRYCACSVVSHMKCVTLAPNEQQSLRQYQKEWLCQSCLSSIFPFNNIVIDNKFIAAINCIDKAQTLNVSDIIFHPFEINGMDHISPLCKKDPDLHFCNSIDPYLSKCNYYEESSFAHIVSNMENLSQAISLCHLNIRSIKNNLSNLVTYMNCLSFRFSIIGFMETWMKDDICDLHGIGGYELFEKHRSIKPGAMLGYSSLNTWNSWNAIICAILIIVLSVLALILNRRYSALTEMLLLLLSIVLLIQTPDFSMKSLAFCWSVC